jgi:hypothetical protein
MCNHQVGKIKKEICYDCSHAYLCYNINSVAHFDSSQSSTVWMALATCMSVKNHQKKVKNKSSLIMNKTNFWIGLSIYSLILILYSQFEYTKSGSMPTSYNNTVKNSIITHGKISSHMAKIKI